MEEILLSGLAELGLEPPEGALGRFRAYYEYLTERNAVMDLTAITGEEETARSHFLDCCTLLRAADFEGRSFIDVGSGAGFPGLPVKIMSPTTRVTLLDSQRKRADFTAECIDRLGLEGIESLCMRAEETPREMRERYDIASSRAVAKLNLLMELCLPFVRAGGVFLAMKGPGCQRRRPARRARALRAALPRPGDGGRAQRRHSRQAQPHAAAVPPPLGADGKEAAVSRPAPGGSCLTIY